nr:hypothetical protein [Tanacetum cinerariifolium]
MPRVVDWEMFYFYSCDETLKDLIKMEYTHVDGDVFVVYSWKEFSLLKEMCTQSGEFFSTMYFERGVDKTKIMTEKCIWFRLCGEEHVLTLSEFAVLLGIKENIDIYGGHYVTKIAKVLRYYVDGQVDKCSDLIECEEWIAKMFES